MLFTITVEYGHQPVANRNLFKFLSSNGRCPAQLDFMATVPESWELGTLIRNGHGRFQGQNVLINKVY